MSPDEFLAFYQDKLRVPFFTAYLTLSGFLFSSKAFVIPNLLKEIYANPAYQEFYFDWHKKGLLKRGPVTRPVRNLSLLLHVAILSSLCTSAAQMSVGFIQHVWAAYFCLALGALTAVFVVLAVIEIRGNVKSWIDFIAEEAKRKNDQRNAPVDPMTPTPPDATETGN